MSRPDPARDGEPVFAAPWEAAVFALQASLVERGVIAPGEWADALGRERAASAAAGIADRFDDGPGTGYYRDFVSALERLLAEKGILDPSVVAARRQAWRDAAAATPHGEPIVLSGGDG